MVSQGDQMEKSIESILNEQDEDQESYNQNSFQQISSRNDSYEKMMEILVGEKKFEGDIDTPTQMEAVCDYIEKLAKNKLDKQDDSYAHKKELIKKIHDVDRIRKILNKIKAGNTVTQGESEFYDDFADDVEAILMQPLVDRALAKDKSETSQHVLKSVLEAFPVEYKTVEDDTYYGLVRPPTGVITWEGDEAREAYKNEGEFNYLKKLPLTDDGKVLKKQKDMREIIATGRFKIKDDKETKDKLQDIFAEFDVDMSKTKKTGHVKNLTKVLNKIDFWKEVAKLF